MTSQPVKELDSRTSLSFPFNGLQLIEASAGTGKTYTIANLYLRHICEGRKVSEVLVVTFTNAATNELRGRIRARLYDALQVATYLADGNEHVQQALQSSQAATGKDDDALDRVLEQVIKCLIEDDFLSGLMKQYDAGEYSIIRDRLTLAVQSMDEAAIFTIHGFCQRTLSEFAFLSNLPFDAELAEDAQLIQAAAEDWWRKTLYPEQLQTAFIYQTLGDFEGFLGFIKPLLGIQHKVLTPPAPKQNALDKKVTGILQKQQKFRATWRSKPYLDTLSKKFQQVTDNDNRIKNKEETNSKLLQALNSLDAWVNSEAETFPLDELRVLDENDPLEGRAFFKKNIPWDEEPYVSATALRGELVNYAIELKRYYFQDAAEHIKSQLVIQKSDLRLLSYDDLLGHLNDALQSNKGDDLAKKLRARFPVAMIDEFQDTDPVQYQIFQSIYLHQEDCGLIMIGDPKQAIYSFRGADIFTYIKARTDVGEQNIWTLTTNWRSTPEVVQAVNRVFDRDSAFVFDEIPFVEAQAAPKAHRHLTIDHKQQPAMNVWKLPLKDKGKSHNVETVRSLTHRATANEIATLIQQGKDGKALIGDKPVSPGDIAVLTRSHYESADLAAELKNLGISAVARNRDNIWHTDEAVSMLQLLEAVTDPMNRKLARRALCSQLFEYTVTEIHQHIFDEQLWETWVITLQSAREAWLTRGFMAAFHYLLEHMGLNRRLYHTPLPERRLTNLLHLAELLQQASKSHPGPDALLSWFRDQKLNAERDTSELRLENDEKLVQIVTIHSSKGLQYPIVFVPYLSLCKPRDNYRGQKPMIDWHDSNKHYISPEWEKEDQHFLLSERERLAEDIRLAYVALTRAESALWLVWGPAGSSSGHAGHTALAWLLHEKQTPGDLGSCKPDAFAGTPLPDFDEVNKKLIRNENNESHLVEITNLPVESDQSTVEIAPEEQHSLEAVVFHGSIASDWRISSFTAMTRDIHQTFASPPQAQPDDAFALRFEAGAHVGSFLHLAFEKLDFTAPDFELRAAEWCSQNAARFGLKLDEPSANHVAAWLHEVISCPLETDGPVLKDLPSDRIVKEMAFDFETGLVDIDVLNRLLDEAPGGNAVQPVTVQQFKGLVNGMIDLVFEHNGRYYIADYKSNLLGRRYDDYSEDKLAQAVYERRYDLQYLLYTLALHRHLSISLPGYNYDQHFGGVYYLFIRAMTVNREPGDGVFQDKPDFSLVNKLTNEIFKWEAAA